MDEYRICRQCGGGFYADQEWKRICFDCWRENKQKNGEWRGQTTTNVWQEKYEAAIRNVQILNRAIDGLQKQLRDRNETAIPDDMLKRLLYLCHPDKHNNSKSSTEATQWLLSKRAPKS